MKLFSCIFSIYILSLLTYPCLEDRDISSLNKTEQSETTNHNDNDCNTCSPFCICNCCQVNTIIAIKESVKAIAPIPVTVTFIYKETQIKDIILSIWQPPKLS